MDSRIRRTSGIKTRLFSFADPESHILFFDIEALIVELLSEEYSAMSPGSLEAAGLISQSEYLKVAALTQSTTSEAHKKIAGELFAYVGCDFPYLKVDSTAFSVNIAALL